MLKSKLTNIQQIERCGHLLAETMSYEWNNLF